MRSKNKIKKKLNMKQKGIGGFVIIMVAGILVYGITFVTRLSSADTAKALANQSAYYVAYEAAIEAYTKGYTYGQTLDMSAEYNKVLEQAYGDWITSDATAIGVWNPMYNRLTLTTTSFDTGWNSGVVADTQYIIIEN